MLTFGCAGGRRAPQSALFAGALMALSTMALSILAPATFSSAQAQEIMNGGCVGGHGSFNCVARWAPAGDPNIRQVPQPTDKAGRALARKRAQRWVDRCRPVIAQDRYGVPRYHYAMPGCEFGVGEY